MRRAIAVHRGGHWPEDASGRWHHARLSRPASAASPPCRRYRRHRSCSTSRERSIWAMATGSSSTTAAMSGCAAPEPVLEIERRRAAPSLFRIAWHLGNRHLPVQVAGGQAAHPRRPCDRRDGRMGLADTVTRSRALRPRKRRLCRAAEHRQPMSTITMMPASPMPGYTASSLGFRRRFPAGGFSYSHGLEAAVESGSVVTAPPRRTG